MTRDEIVMYEEKTAGFSAGTASLSSLLSEDCFYQKIASSSVPSHTHNPNFPDNVSLSMETLAFAPQQHAMITNIDASVLIEPNPYGVNSNFVEGVNHHHHDSNQLIISSDQSKWDTVAMSSHHQSRHHHRLQDQPVPYPITADLHHCDHLPNGLLSSSSTSSFVNSTSLISYGNPATQKNFEELQINNPSGCPTLGLENTNVSSALLNDSFLHMNLPAGSPPNREWFQSLPARNGLLMFGEDDDKEGSGVLSYLDAGLGREFGDSNNDFLKFSSDLAPYGRSKRGGRGGKRVRQVTIEKKRRVDFTSKFDSLRELIPNPTKSDRASLLCGAIEYIQELRRSVHNLTLLVNKKRSSGKERIKRQKVEEAEEEDKEEALGDLESCNLKPHSEEPDHHHHHDQHLLPINGCIIRNSWLHKKSEDTEVDVRIVDDEVTIKLVWRKNTNCLLYASKALDELELDLQHVAGGHIGDFCSFLFNSKMYEGSSACASAIADKLIEVMEAA